MLANDGHRPFRNIDALTAFADYKIPQVLRELGILEYSTTLAQKVDSRIELAPGSEEEVEIRAGTIIAVEDIRQATSGNLTAADIDHYLWLAGQRTHARPYHRTRTIAY